MDISLTSTEYTELGSADIRPHNESSRSAVSWGAVIAGAFAAAALYLILLALGAGFGLTAIAPWSNAGLSASEAGWAAIIWLIVIEIVSSGLGGYLTGRLRTKWTLLHTDEVFFRDTANGFLAWAVALIASAALLSSATASMAGGIAQLPSSELTAAADPNAYLVDTLFRSDGPSVENKNTSVAGETAEEQAEAERILANSLRAKEMTRADRSYLAQMIAAKTGISQPEADKRISDVLAQAKHAEDTAQKLTAHFLLWLFLSLLLGALSASYCATIGGRQRDHVHGV